MRDAQRILTVVALAALTAACAVERLDDDVAVLGDETADVHVVFGGGIHARAPTMALTLTER